MRLGTAGVCRNQDSCYWPKISEVVQFSGVDPVMWERITNPAPDKFVGGGIFFVEIY